MSLAFCVLGSGSAGNSTLLVTNGADAAPMRDRVASLDGAASHDAAAARRCILLDAGLSPRRTARLLHRVGVESHEVETIILTHLDSDHFRHGWVKAIARRREAGQPPLRIFVHRRHRNAAWRAGLTARETTLFDDHLELPGGANAEPILLAHDDLGSVGFVIECDGHRLGYATDLGRVTRAMVERFVNLHALALESNYDPPMQQQSDRPVFLKRRITGGSGHLSNHQALEAAREIERSSALSHIALLHLSEECNCPRRVRGLWQREMPHALARLTITHQRRPTPLLRITGPRQRPHFEWKQGLLFDGLLQSPAAASIAAPLQRSA